MRQFKIRFAKQSDRETVLKFCQNTWIDSEDYIHLVWDKWLEDDRGKIFVVTNSDDIPIAIRRVVLMSETESWWEGFRLDLNYRQYFLSVIALLEKHINRYLIENNIPISRSCVWSNSKTMQAFTSQRKKRERVGKYALYQAEIIKNSDNNIIQLNLDDFKQVCYLISKYNFYPESNNNIIYASINDKCQKLTEQQIKKQLQLRKIWGLKVKDKISNLAIASPAKIDKKQLWLGYLTGELATLSTLLIELRKLAYTQKYSSVGLFVPPRENVLKSLDLTRSDRAEKQDLFVYQWQNN